LPEAYRLDSRRCISYWTIEHRGDLPPAAREMIGDWVFGCDLCQEACPHNRRALPGREPALRLPPQRRELDLAGLLALDQEGYVARFQVTAMKRAKLEGLQRNAAVVMGNRRDPAYVPALSRALGAESPVVRKHAAWSLGRIGGAEATAALHAALAVEADEAVRGEIATALGF
jgi:epoxyqueuosine reductase